MSVIEPFHAIRYPQREQTDLVAPPYDVLSGEQKAAMLLRNGHNIVAVDLPHIPPKSAGPDSAYAAAARTFEGWLAAGVLQRDDKAALYAYQQTYTHAGTTYKRRGFFARVKLEEFGSGTIHPHEQTFSGPKEDRLKLMRATRTNLSPVFGLYDDPSNDVTDLLFEAVHGKGRALPLASANLPSQDGKGTVLSELWAVTDAAVIADVRKMMADKHLYIADGHHRYTTCLNYRKELADAGKKTEGIDYTMFALIALQDAGLIIMPTHRVVATDSLEGFYMDAFVAAALPTCEVIETKFNGDSLDKLEHELAGHGPHAMGVYDPIEDTAIVIRPKIGDPLSLVSSGAVKGKSAAWRQLDVAILQHLVFEQIVQPNFVPKGGAVNWAFPHEAHEVATLCRSGQYRVGFLLQPTPLAAVRDLCNANELMPQKSTFFYPKLATGMVMNRL